MSRPETSAPIGPIPSRIAWLRSGLCLLLAASAAAGLAWPAVAVQLEPHMRSVVPLGGFSLLGGLAVGGAIRLLTQLLRIGHRPTQWGILLVVAVVFLVAEHLLFFQIFQQSWEARVAGDARAALFRPEYVENPLAYFQAAGFQNGQWKMWLLDASIVTIAIGATVTLGRRPYCGRCEQWYRTIWRRQCNPTLAAECLGRLDCSDRLPTIPIQFEVVRCPPGCGPACFNLSWPRGWGTQRISAWSQPEQAVDIMARLAESD